MRRTKIVCTLGPSSCTFETISALIESGMSVARINFSHGTHDSHKEIIEVLKAVRKKLNLPVALMLDTSGPEIRTKTLSSKYVLLEQGQGFTLTSDDIVGDETRVSVTYENLAEDLKAGNRVLIDDGLIALRVLNIENNDINCIVEVGGYLSDRKGVNLPDAYLQLPSLTEKDIKDLLFGIENDFDFIAASFIRSANDVIKIRNILDDNKGSHIKIISKIENADGVKNIDEILEVSDGIMVARGDLGVEIPPEEVPLIQKMLIKKSNKAAKPVITATQMLESMVNSPSPTRAEANDVANAILDGSDAVMLSGETAKGDYPIEAVQMMAKIAENAEEGIDYKEKMKLTTAADVSITNAISYAACTTAYELQTACISTVTNSGFTARMVSKFRPYCPIVACSYNAHVCRQLNLLWGVRSVLIEPISTDAEIYEVAIKCSADLGFAMDGDLVAVVAGTPVGVSGSTNTLKVEMVGDVFARGYAGFGTGIVKGKSNVVTVVDEASVKFKKGDILVTSKTNNNWLEHIKKAKAVIVGPTSQTEDSHTEIVCTALGIPCIICNQSVVDSIPDNIYLALDLDKGIIRIGD